MMARIERLVVRWLERRGYVVLAPPFVGMCLGFCIASLTEADAAYDVYTVDLPKGARLIALNNSVVYTKPEKADG